MKSVYSFKICQMMRHQHVSVEHEWVFQVVFIKMCFCVSSRQRRDRFAPCGSMVVSLQSWIHRICWKKLLRSASGSCLLPPLLLSPCLTASHSSPFLPLHALPAPVNQESARNSTEHLFHLASVKDLATTGWCCSLKTEKDKCVGGKKKKNPLEARTL